MEKVSEGPTRITEATIEAAWRRRRAGFRLTIRDAECRGLALVVNPTGMSWMLSYKPRGLNPRTGKRPSTREVLLGTPATLSPEQARGRGKVMKGEAKGGGDPAQRRKTQIADAPRDRVATISRLLDQYSDVLPTRPKLRGTGQLSREAAVNEMRSLRLAAETMAVMDLPVVQMGAWHLRKLLHAEAKRPATARHRFGAVSRFLEWCQDEGIIPRNPAGDVSKARRPRAPQPRSHHLSLPELAKLWRAAELVEASEEATGFHAVHRDLVRFLIALPCRRAEAAAVEWSHLDLHAPAWIIPGQLTKNGDPHRLPLPHLAHVLVLTRWEAAGQPTAGLVFPSPKAKGPIATWSDMKAAMDKASGLAGWRWHDLRRSFVTALAEHGVAEVVADAMLNPRRATTQGGVLGVYQQAKRRPEQDAAMRRWDEVLTAAIEERDGQPGC